MNMLISSLKSNSLPVNNFYLQFRHTKHTLFFLKKKRVSATSLAAVWTTHETHETHVFPLYAHARVKYIIILFFYCSHVYSKYCVFHVFYVSRLLTSGLQRTHVFF